MFEIFQDTIIDTIKLIPFLFITYFIMEYIENKTSKNYNKKVSQAGKLGPLIGGIVGIFPQCGFSASATNLYASGMISVGTLIAVYLSTSDEMVPIFLSEAMPIKIMIKILAIKLILAVIFGFIIDFIINKILKKKGTDGTKNKDICEQEHCHCHENGVLKSSLVHTLNIVIYIFIVTLIINFIVNLVGENTIEKFLTNNVLIGPVIASLIGLIPNCAASVIITNLYIENVINMATLISGLLTGAGVGLIILFRMNKNCLKENLTIVGTIYLIGVISGWILQLII